MALPSKVARLVVDNSPAWSLGSFPRRFFFVSLAGSWFCGSFLAWLIAAVGLSSWFPPRSALWDNITFFLDPWLLQLLFAALTTAFCLRLPKHRGPLQRLAIALWPFVLIVATWALGSLLFKEAFGYVRPPTRMAEPWFTVHFRDAMLNFGIGAGGALPSGFLARQLVITYFFGLVLANTNNPTFNHSKTPLYALGCILLVAIMLSRYYRENYSLFDIALTFPMATALFWLMMAPLYRLIDIPTDVTRRLSTKDLWNAVVASVVTTVILFPYALRPVLLLEQMLRLIAFFGVVYLAIDFVHSHQQQGQPRAERTT